MSEKLTEGRVGFGWIGIFPSVMSLLILIPFETQQTFAQWVQTSGPPGGTIWSISSNASGTVFAGSTSGLYRSTDEGQSWQKTQLPLQRYWVIANDLDSTFYAMGYRAFYLSKNNGTSWEEKNVGSGEPWWVITRGRTDAYCITSIGFFHSTDDGDSWLLVNSSIQNNGVTHLAMNSKGLLYGAGTDSGVFVSADSGLTWKRIQSGSHIYTLYSNDSGTYIGTIRGIYKTTDNGTNWIQTNNGLKDTVIQCIYSASKDLIFAATSGGLYFSTNQGDNWSRCSNGIPNSYMLSVFADSNGIVFAGNYSRGIYKSTDYGVTWTASRNGLVNSRVTSTAFTSKGTLVCTTDYGLSTSTDRGDSWSTPLVSGGLSSVTLNAHDSIFTVSSNGLYLSSDEGVSWKIVGPSNVGVSSLCITKRGTIIANTASGLQRSSDGGVDWLPIDIDLQIEGYKGTIRSIVAGTNAEAWIASDIGVYHSADDGLTWMPSGLGPNDVFAFGVAPDGRVLASVNTAQSRGYRMRYTNQQMTEPHGIWYPTAHRQYLPELSMVGSWGTLVVP